MTRFNVGLGGVGWGMIILVPVMTLLVLVLGLLRFAVGVALVVTLGAALVTLGILALGLGLQRAFAIDAVSITARGRTYAFAEVARIHVSSFRGTTAMSLSTTEGRSIVVFALNTSVRPALTAEQWIALRGLIAGAGTTFIQRGAVSRRVPRPKDTVPLSVALAAVDAEIASLGPYGRTSQTGPFIRAVLR